ncbi:MAG TPA: hypothetical protein VLK25_10710 [Allosphingosinicella sp.]|nr:hypothetical protein [Allosphingosinicella sp.]
MIIVIGSRHDPVAVAMADSWPGAGLCGAEDFTRPGWVWRLDDRTALRWVVGGHAVPDVAISGVLVRRRTFYPEEFPATHPDDRAYLAAEAHAFLVAMLSVTGARVANPARDGMFGDEAIRLDRWLAAARDEGLVVRPVRVSSDDQPRRRTPAPLKVEVVGGDAFGAAPPALKAGAVRLARAMDLLWATALFDGRRRLLTITGAAAPDEEARAALGTMLAG